jgi:hypothetical protein
MQQELSASRFGTAGTRDRGGRKLEAIYVSKLVVDGGENWPRGKFGGRNVAADGISGARLNGVSSSYQGLGNRSCCVSSTTRHSFSPSS